MIYICQTFYSFYDFGLFLNDIDEEQIKTIRFEKDFILVIYTSNN